MSEYIIRTTNMPEHIREAVSAWYEIDYEIVRCRDCAKCDESKAYGKWFCHRFSMCDGAGFPVEPDGFCAWASRREP